MAMVIYSIDPDRVDPVFFPVVPDSFMMRGETGECGRRSRWENGEWLDVVDAPVIAPRDPWSF